MKNSLRGLLEIAQLLRDRDLTALAKQKAEQDGLRLARENLVRKTEYEQKIALSDLHYQRFCRDPRASWLQGRIVGLTQQQARSAAEVESYKRAASKSFGRAAVLRKILENQEKLKP